MKIFILLATLALGCNALPTDLDSQWLQFKTTHKKNYDALEEIEKFVIFTQNLNKIQAHNQQYEEGKQTYRMGINQFADLTQDQFIAYLKRSFAGRPALKNTITYTKPQNLQAPSEIDWRDMGAVTRIKDQGQCGSCWTFSSTGVLESQNFLINGQLLDLSQQELVDCSKENAGCDGGLMQLAFEYVIDNGITTEDNYPYEARDGQCRRGSLPTAVRATGYVAIRDNDEDDLLSAVGNSGPVAVAVDASYWQFYDSGIMYDQDCSSKEELLNHEVLAIGYGTESGTDYWLLKNSWGTSWGESGFLRIIRNRNNCGVATDANYPIIG